MSFEISTIKGLILDMDGVLWRDNMPLLDLPAFFTSAQNKGLKVVLASNNSTKSVAQYLEKLAGLNAHLEPWQVVNSTLAVGYYLHQRHPNGGPVYIFGEKGLIDALDEVGFHHAEDDVLAVVVGLDRQLNYKKFTRVMQLIRSGIPFIGTNPDKTFPTPTGLTPGAGAVLAFIEAATGVKPTIVGKPEPFLFELALSRLNLPANEVLAIGDRLDTDILGGHRAGCHTGVVLSGVSSMADVKSYSPAPDLILNNLADLLDLMPGITSVDSELKVDPSRKKRYP